MRLFNRIKGDKVIWIVILLLSSFSTVVVYSASNSLAYRFKDGHSEYFLFKHLALCFIGISIIYYIHKLNLKIQHFNLIGVIGFILSIPLLIYTLLSGVRSGDATRWIEVPGLGITFQSSDIAKIAMIIFISRNLTFYRDKLNTLKNIFLKILLPTSLIYIPILISNFSTAFLLAATIFYLILLSDIKLNNIIKILGLVLLVSALFITLIYFFPNTLPRGKTWKMRIENFMTNDIKTNYQVMQAKIAIANGPLIGKGPGNSAQRAFLPQASSDFIYAIIIEEYGSVIGVFILVFFLIIFFRCIRITQKASHPFYAYIVAGLSFNLMLQAFINMAVSVNIIPVTGQPLPFISMGGSSLIFSSAIIGIILNISKQIDTEIKSTTHNNIVPDNNTKSKSNKYLTQNIALQ